MPVSYASVSTQNMELTPMRVSFGPSGSEVDLGGTLDNVVIGLETQKAEILADQSGKTPRDQRVSGQAYKVTTKLTQIRDKDKWKVVFPHAKLITSGPNKSMYFDAQIGASDIAVAGRLLLHPLSKLDADKSGDYLFYKATATSVSEISYGPEEQSGLQVEWMIYPDDSVQPERFFLHGDPAIGMVNASAAAAVAGGGNVGNGTVGSITVTNAATKTETITITFYQAVLNAGKFTVEGSLSGYLGLGNVGVAFSSPEISFTIADGATDFAVGDTFTIATTGANYA